ncbi:MAG: hypothetical protein M3O28_01400 [Actinomycetota bacterium]|nr:hypothetical protein [Actinomycetota bacterium]
MTSVEPTLTALLRAQPPDSVLALGPQANADLVQIVRDARRRQARDLAAAFDATMKHVPFPVRVIVKKVLGV